MVVGDPSYQLNLSRIAFNFKGAANFEYLEAASVERVQQLSKHLKAIAEELKTSG